MDTAYIIIPGLHDSDPSHWQSRWAKEFGNFYRVKQTNWDTPERSQWVSGLDNAIQSLGNKQIYLIAHSMGCLTLAHWAATAHRPIAGALLVAPPDVHSPLLWGVISGFDPLPQTKLPFNSILVASSNDQYATIETAQNYAQSWGSRFVNIGERGHINTASSLGLWPEGLELLDSLVYHQEQIII